MNIKRKYKLFLLDLLDDNDRCYNLFKEIINIKTFKLKKTNSLKNYYAIFSYNMNGMEYNGKIYFQIYKEYNTHIFNLYEEEEEKFIILDFSYRSYLEDKYNLSTLNINEIFILVFNVDKIEKSFFEKYEKS